MHLESFYCNSIKPKPSLHKGKRIGLTQVTHKTSIEDYAKLDLEFITDNGSIILKVEAYLVKNMSSPLILGNDFAEQYEISILRKNGTTRLQFGKFNNSILLQNVNKPNEKVSSLMTKVDMKTHKKSNKVKVKENSNSKQGICSVLLDTDIPPNTSKRVKLNIPWKEEMAQGYNIEPGGKLSINNNLEVLDRIFLKNQDSIIVSNKSGETVTLRKGEKIATLHSTSILDETPNDEALDNMGPLVSFIKTHTKEKSLERLEGDIEGKEVERELGPNIISTNDMDPIRKDQLLTTLDINKNLENSKYIQLERVILKRYKALQLMERLVISLKSNIMSN